MFEGHRIAVVIPAHNESALLAQTLRGVPTWVDRVIVVDDGSQDGTDQVARAWFSAESATEVRASEAPRRFALVRHRSNRGVGAAIDTGYRHAFAKRAPGGAVDVAVVMAGDAQMSPDDLPALLVPVVRGAAEYSKGSRLSHGTVVRDMPLTRWLGNHALSAITRLCAGVQLRDSQCGYTALHRRAWRAIQHDVAWAGYGYPNELIARVSARGLRVCDVTVRAVYGQEKSGVGLRHALGIVPWVILRSTVTYRLKPWLAPYLVPAQQRGRRAMRRLPRIATRAGLPRQDEDAVWPAE